MKSESRAEIDRVGAVLAAMLGAVRRIDPLSSGTTGTTYLVSTADASYAAKAFAPDCLALLGPAQQFCLLEALADSGIAPRPAGFDAAERLLVTEFLGQTSAFTPESMRQPDGMAAVTATLRVLHSAKAALPPFDPAACARRYLSAIGGVGELADRDRRRFEELLDLAGSLRTDARCLCHNDLEASNLLLDRQLRLVDFDYAVLAPPEVDLASVAVMNGFSESQASDLLDRYFDGSSPLAHAEFARVQRLVRLLAHFWSLASADAGADIVGQYRIRHD